MYIYIYIYIYTYLYIHIYRSTVAPRFGRWWVISSSAHPPPVHLWLALVRRCVSLFSCLGIWAYVCFCVYNEFSILTAHNLFLFEHHTS